MKKILITAAGTATAWHICNIIREFYNEEFEINICDINEKEMIPASTLCDKYIKVPLAKNPNYRSHMYDLLKEEKIDIIIPLLPYEMEMFSSDDEELRKLGIITTAPSISAINQLNDKENMYGFCIQHNLPTVELVSFNDLKENEKYILKPKVGFGSLGVRVNLGREIKEEYYDEYVVQKLCQTDGKAKEATVEIFNTDRMIKILCRERLEVKSGVCTKMKIFHDSEIQSIIETFVKNIDCPKAFNIQFIMDKNKWNIMDVNLRLGAGTALSSAAGFELTKALLASLLGYEIKEEWFQVDESIKTVLRVYDEVVIH